MDAFPPEADPPPAGNRSAISPLVDVPKFSMKRRSRKGKTFIVYCTSMSLIKDFKQFLLRGNVVDMAVGVVIGVAFGGVVGALVSDFLTPLVGAIAKVPDFSGLTFTLNGSQFMYGHFLNSVISFLLVAGAIFFFVVKPMAMLTARDKKAQSSAPTVKTCPECLSEIPAAARRCAHCTQVIA
jgi:large conductance mechanosensitive channel